VSAIESAEKMGFRARFDGRPRTSNYYTARAFRDAWFRGYDRATRKIRGTSKKGKS
jgi:ribosome modulation factor